jgi:branched-chain amino acid transport system substrate-binding protein
MVSYLEDGAMLVKTIGETKLRSLLCGGAGGYTSKTFIDRAGSHANLLLTATLWTPSLKYSGTKDYYHAYLEKYAAPPDYHGAEAYSALLVVADVLSRAGSHSPEGIRKAIDATDLITPFGPIKFTAFGKFERQNRLPTQVLQITDGRFECVWPEEQSTAAFIPPPFWRAGD